MSWLVLNLIFGILVTALIIGVLSTGMHLEYGKRSERNKPKTAVVPAAVDENTTEKVKVAA